MMDPPIHRDVQNDIYTVILSSIACLSATLSRFPCIYSTAPNKDQLSSPSLENNNNSVEDKVILVQIKEATELKILVSKS